MSAPARRPMVVAATLIFLLALAMRFGFWSEIRGSALDRWHLFDQTDMATYIQQAIQFARGDWLARSPFHPYHDWQAVAPPEKWLEWYGPHTFHQAPAYSFLIALTSKVAGDPLVWVKVAQLVLGAASAVLALALAHRLAGPLAGWAAGALWAVYAPLFHLEAQLLREGPALFATMAILLATVGALGRRPSSRRRELLACAGLGAAVGLFHLFHEMGTVLLLVVAGALAADRVRLAPRRAGLALACVLGGYLLGFSPLLARNLAVGAPPLSVSCRTVINFVLANEAGAPMGGSTFSPAGPTVVRILDDAQGSALRAVRGVWATYDGDVVHLARNWLLRLAAVLKWVEEADNTSFYFYRTQTRLLGACPTFTLLFPLGLAGAAAVLLGAWRSRTTSEGAALHPFVETWRRHPAGHLALLLFLFGVVGSLSLVHTVARFRLYVTPFFFVYAGASIALAVAVVRQRKPGAALLLGAVALGAVALQHAITGETERDLHRTTDFAMATVLAVETGDYAAAEAFAEAGARRDVGDPILYAELGVHLERHRQWARAAEAYRRALAMSPGLDVARQGLQRARAAQGLPP